MACIFNFRIILHLNFTSGSSRYSLKAAFGVSENLMNCISTTIREINIPNLHLSNI